MNKVYYANAVYGKEEVNAVNKVLKNHLTLMDGPLVKEFETKVAKVFGKKFDPAKKFPETYMRPEGAKTYSKGGMARGGGAAIKGTKFKGVF